VELVSNQALALLDQDTPTMDDQWDIVLKLIGESEPNKSAIFRYIYLQYKGSTYYRVCAACEYLKKYPNEGRRTLEELIRSKDPDDRDTAVTVISEFNDPELRYLARQLLNDKYPYIQFAAIEILYTKFPDEVKIALNRLLDHEERWVRDKARRLLGEYTES
jgi:HEAT repeat protein